MLRADDDVDPSRPPGPVAVVVRVAEEDEAALRGRGLDVVGTCRRERVAYKPERHIARYRTEGGRGETLAQVRGGVRHPDREPVAARADPGDVLRLAGHVGRGADQV